MRREQSPDPGEKELCVLVRSPPDDLAVETLEAGTEGLSVSVADGPDAVGDADCLLWFPASDGADDETAVDAPVPVVACVRSDDDAGRALAAGATEVYRFDGDCSVPVLARRIRTAVAANVAETETGSAVMRADSRHERRLRRLVEATQELMAADSTEAVAEATSEAASELTSFPGTGFRRYDPEREVLELVAIGGNVEGIEDRPDYGVADSPHGRAFRTGETVVEDVPEADPYDREVFSQTMYVPVGEYGVLSVGLVDGEFDAADRQFAELLAASAAAALDRARRRERLLRYEGAIERAAGKVYALDDDDRFTLVSPSLADWLGYDRAALRGDPVESVLDDAAVEGGVDSGSAFDAAEGRSFETTVVTADGERIPAELEAAPLYGPDGESGDTVGTIRDISELEAAREQLSDERDRFTYLFENLPDAVAEVELFDGEAVIRSANERFAETFGPDADGVVGRSLDEFVLPPEFHEEGKRLNQRAAEGEALETYVRRQSAEGTRHFLLRAVPYEVTGGRTRSFVIYTDVTEQKQRERYLRVVNRVLRHNLRNDLNLVDGYAEQLLDGVEEDGLVAYADRIRDTVERMLSQSEAAREVQVAIRQERDGTETVDLSESVRETVDAFRERSPGATLTTDLPETAPIAAGRRVGLVVENLVENAVVHGGTGTPRVDVRVTSCDDHVRLLVEDDGPGIPASERAVVSEDREITPLEHGSGLGLWVVKWLVENYGGRVEFVDSSLGGAGVRVTFHAGD